MLPPDAAPIVGIRDPGLLAPDGRKLLAVEVLLDADRCDGLRLGMQVVMLQVVAIEEGDGDGPAG